MIDEAKLLYLQEINDSPNHGVTKNDVGELIAALRAAWAENKHLRDAQEWRPIESAPKDGTNNVLVCCERYFGDRKVAIGWFQDGDWRTFPAAILVRKVRLWMPFPEPPKE